MKITWNLFFKVVRNPVFLLTLILVGALTLRLYNLNKVPGSLFGDELDLGYHAYSVLKTGRDYQGNLFPLSFHSLAEWRTPLYLYSAIPTVAIFGITPLGVRIPALIFGVLSVLGIYLLSKEIFKAQKNCNALSLTASFIMAISPWSLQYSRAGFEVTEMLFFVIMGVYFFLRSLEDSKFLPYSVFCLLLTPWIYSTAKLFAPILILILFLLHKKEILGLKSKHLIYSFVIGVILGAPMIYSIFVGDGAQRFNYISVFSDPTTESNIGFSRERAGRLRGEDGAGLTPKLQDRIFYNKFTYWGEKIFKNYINAYSPQFFFDKGDPNLRQSIGMGQLFRIEVIALVIAVVFVSKIKIRKNIFILFFWLLAAGLPSAITMDGGNHATRLFVMLPPLILLIAYGWNVLVDIFPKKYIKLSVLGISAMYILSLTFYLNEYYGPYIYSSERWWHYGWGEAVKEVKSIDHNYDKVVISMSGEPAWIFFAGYYQYPPKLWQENFPIGHDVFLDGFGKISNTGKFYFGSPEKDIQIYGLGKYINSKTLYLANASEVGENLSTHPEKSPHGLKLLKVINYPSGSPAMYLFTGSSN